MPSILPHIWIQVQYECLDTDSLFRMFSVNNLGNVWPRPSRGFYFSRGFSDYSYLNVTVFILFLYCCLCDTRSRVLRIRLHSLKYLTVDNGRMCWMTFSFNRGSRLFKGSHVVIQSHSLLNTVFTPQFCSLFFENLEMELKFASKKFPEQHQNHTQNTLRCKRSIRLE